MKRISLALILLLSLYNSAFAFSITHSLMFYDEENVDKRCEQYIEELKSCDIHMTKPADFNPIEFKGSQFIFRNIAAGEDVSGCSMEDIAAVVLGSDDKNAVLIYPTIPLTIPVNLCGSTVEEELRANYDNDTLDIRPMIKMIGGKNLREYANADTAVVYNLDFKRPFLNDYTHCIGIYLRKYAHHSLLLKVVMTDEGWENRESYIKSLLDNLRYGDELMPSYVKWEERPINKRRTDFNYPSKPVPPAFLPATK